MTAARTPRINLIGLGVQSAAMASLLEAMPIDVAMPQGADGARAAVQDLRTPLILDGAESSSIAATRIRTLGLDEVLPQRIESGGRLLVCSHAALALGSGRLKGAIRGLGIVPAEILRVPGFPMRGVRRINGARPERAWFDHEYMFMTPDGNWSAQLLPTGLLAKGGVRICAFDPARSAGFGREYVMEWFQESGLPWEEAA